MQTTKKAVIRLVFLWIGFLVSCDSNLGSQSEAQKLRPYFVEVSRLHEFGRPCSWQPQVKNIEGEPYTILAGPNAYQDEADNKADFYTLAVHYTHSKGSVAVYRNDLEMNTVSPDWKTLQIEEAASFDSETRIVTFTIGSKSYEYELPPK